MPYSWLFRGKFLWILIVCEFKSLKNSLSTNYNTINIMTCVLTAIKVQSYIIY